jgi:hypothetical protein
MDFQKSLRRARSIAGLAFFSLLTTSLTSAQDFDAESPDFNIGPQEAGEDVDLELVLAVDISFSVDGVEARMQREGYISAISHPSVLAAIESGFLGKIAVTYVEWADAYYQNQLVHWSVVSDEESAMIFAGQLAGQPLNRAYYTSISHAIDFSTSLFEGNGYVGLRKVIDISGDGPHNQGRRLSDARREALDKGITINGLPILNDRPQPWGIMSTPRDMQLDLYYSDYVIGGPGAFFVTAEDFVVFRSAILSKLIREIANVPTSDISKFATVMPRQRSVAIPD